MCIIQYYSIIFGVQSPDVYIILSFIFDFMIERNIRPILLPNFREDTDPLKHALYFSSISTPLLIISFHLRVWQRKDSM